MRIALLFFVVALSGLAGAGCISKNTEKFQQQVKKWVPIGTKTAKAQHIMERKGFECNVLVHGNVFNTNDVDYLDCVREQVWFHDWQARIVLKDGKVVDYGPAEVK
jgi:hypothetical protein